MGGPETGAGEHRRDRLGDHRHVDGHPVAGLDAELRQRIGCLAYELVQIGIRDRAAVALTVAHPVVRHLVADAGVNMAVEAVDRRVELPADEPLGERRLPLQRRVPPLRPLQPVGLLLPEGDPVTRRLVVELWLRIRVPRQVLRWLEPTVLVQQRIECRLVRRHHAAPSERSARGRCGQFYVPGYGSRPRPENANRLPTGTQARSTMPLMTPADDAYQAATAVSTPTYPPNLMMPVLFAKLPMHRMISVTSSVRKTPKTAMLTCVLHSSM